MNKLTIVNLREVFEQQGEGQFEGWLYLPQIPWTLETEGIFMMEDIDADPNKKFPPALLEQCRLTPTLDATGIEDVIAFSKNKNDTATTEELLNSFKFYVENDAFLD